MHSAARPVKSKGEKDLVNERDILDNGDIRPAPFYARVYSAIVFRRRLIAERRSRGIVGILFRGKNALAVSSFRLNGDKLFGGASGSGPSVKKVNGCAHEVARRIVLQFP